MKHAVASLTLAVMLGTSMLQAQPVDVVDSIPVTTTPGRTLEDFFTAALNYSPALVIARETWNIGSARKDATNGQLLPQVTASGTRSENEQQQQNQLGQTQETEFSGERYSLQVSQVLFNWQAFAARSQAYLLEDQAEAEYYAELANVLTDIADKYLSVLQAEDALVSLDSEYEAVTNQVNQIQSLFDRQLARVTDLYDAQARVAAIQARRVTAESELLIAREALRGASGMEVGDLSRLPDEIVVTPLEGGLAEWIERARTNNRLIEARTYALQSAQKRISAERGAYMPRVSLVYQLQNSNMGFQNTLNPEVETQYVGVDVTMPIFAGGSNRAAVREAFSQRNIAESQLRQVELEAEQNTRTAYQQIKAGESQIEAARVLVESTTTAYTAMQRGFELAAVTSVDMLNALRDQFQASRDLQQARYDHLRAGLILRREAGILSADDLINVSSLLNGAPASSTQP